MTQIFAVDELVRAVSNGQIYIIQSFTSEYPTFGPAYIARHLDSDSTVLLNPNELRALEGLEVLALTDRIKHRVEFLTCVLGNLRNVESTIL